MAIKTKTAKKAKKITVNEGIIHVLSHLNNIIVTVTDIKGNALKQDSGGVSFNGSKKATPHAAFVVADRISKWCNDHGIARVDVRFKGIGQGRDVVARTMAQKGINIEKLSDVTPIPHGGCRPRKAPRK